MGKRQYMNILAGIGLLLALTACGSTNTNSQHHITIGLTYIPNIQFAPIYVAAQLGYYRDAGLDVTLHHHTFNDPEFGALASGQEDMIYAGGDEILQANTQHVPVTYLAQIYTKYPIVLIVPANSPIHTAADLRGHSIGIPGPYGSTYLGLLELLQKGNLTTSDVTIQSIGFTQAQALASGKVDAVMGSLLNETIQLQKLGFAVRTIPVFDDNETPFISYGLAASHAELAAHPNDVKAFIAATLRGVNYVIAHPQDAVRLSQAYVTVLSDPAQASTALATLQAAIPLWQHAGQPTSQQAWQAMAQLMQAHGLLSSNIDVTTVYSNNYLS